MVAFRLNMYSSCWNIISIVPVWGQGHALFLCYHFYPFLEGVGMTKTVDINFNFIDILACFFYNSSRNDVSNNIKSLPACDSTNSFFVSRNFFSLVMYPIRDIFIFSGLLNLNPPRRHLHRWAVATPPRPPQRSLFFLWGKVGAATRRPTPPQLGINKFTVSLKTTNVNSTSKIYVTFDTQFPFSSLGVCVENIQLCSFKGFSYRSLCTWLTFPDILWITKPRSDILCCV